MRLTSGYSLIELVLALVIIGITSTTVASLLVTSLDFARRNASYEEDLRAAVSCYETILATDEAKEWRSNRNQYVFVNACEAGTQVTAARLSAWLKRPAYTQLFARDSDKPAICTHRTPTCEKLQINSKDAVRFTIPIRGDQALELVIPVIGNNSPGNGGP